MFRPRGLLLGLISIVCILGYLVSPAQSQTSEQSLVSEPFIIQDLYKENISLEKFIEDGRELFRSNKAFTHLTGYVSNESGYTLTGAEFWAVMRDESQTRVRNCPTTETIRTGALKGDQFNWFSRKCYEGEQIVQVKGVHGWRDVFSLACLNAVEDKTELPPPDLNPKQPQQEITVVEPDLPTTFCFDQEITVSVPETIEGIEHDHMLTCTDSSHNHFRAFDSIRGRVEVKKTQPIEYSSTQEECYTINYKFEKE